MNIYLMFQKSKKITRYSARKKEGHMKNNTLLKPLTYSALILLLLSTLLYLTGDHPEATVWSSMGLILLGILRTVQWLIAMALALLACLAFLFALFLGAVALFNREVSAQMYHNLKTTLLSSLIPLTEKCCSTTNATQPSLQAEDADQQRYESLKAEVNTSQEHLETTKQVLTKAIDQLTTRIETLEAISADMAGKQQVEDIGHDVEATKDVLTGMQNTVSALQSTVDQNAKQLQETSPDNILGDLPQRLKNLEEQQGAESPEPLDIKPLQDDINSIQAELNHVKEKADQALLEL
ncbi:MAG: hypothetical protein D3909_02890, partial [Candidatus Electrothrix sp. ATG1]|nr:hypothetical protein [Candidatus Electrothrix sp. ATG1]